MKKKQQENCELEDSTAVLSSDWYRTIEITGIIEQESCSAFINYMNKLLIEDPNEMITILISSNGGHIEETFSMYDIIRHARKTCIVRTICYGRAYSAGSLLLSCGTNGYRYAYPSATAMMHGVQLEGMIYGNINSVTLPMVQNALDDYKKFVDYYAYELMKQLDKEENEFIESQEALDSLSEKLMMLMNQDTYLSAEQMLEMNLINKIGIPELELACDPIEMTEYKNSAKKSEKWDLIEVKETNE